jgi:hypothetical protein
LPEDKGVSTDQFKGLGGMTEQVTQLYGAAASGIVGQTEMTTGMENSKEFVEFNFKDHQYFKAMEPQPMVAKSGYEHSTQLYRGLKLRMEK